MSSDYEVIVTLRVTGEDAHALFAAAGSAVPDAVRADGALAQGLALQALIAPPNPADAPGVRRWSGEGWHSSVEVARSRRSWIGPEPRVCARQQRHLRRLPQNAYARQSACPVTRWANSRTRSNACAGWSHNT
jgi:hypothetical protein